MNFVSDTYGDAASLSPNPFTLTMTAAMERYPTITYQADFTIEVICYVTSLAFDSSLTSSINLIIFVDTYTPESLAMTWSATTCDTPITYNASPEPAWLVIDATSKTLDIQPSDITDGPVTVSITVEGEKVPSTNKDS